MILHEPTYHSRVGDEVKIDDRNVLNYGTVVRVEDFTSPSGRRGRCVSARIDRYHCPERVGQIVIYRLFADGQ